MTNYNKIENYVYEFFSNRFEHFDHFYRTTHRDRQYGIYKLKYGNRLMDFIISIHSIIEDQLNFKNLIPHKFASPEALLSSLNSFKDFLESNQKYIDANLDGEDTSYIVSETLKMKNEILEMINYVKKIYDFEDTIIPYQELRSKLVSRNIDDFIKILKSILASVSYSITKSKEGYYHSNVHLILKLLGFEIISEEQTSDGRIDSVIRFSDTIYIIEFKFNQTKDLSDEALKQIKDKNYAVKYLIENKDIYAIGVSFDENIRNINGYKFEKLVF